MTDFMELEYKYKADDVKLTDFQVLMEELGYKKYLDVSSWDVYYTMKGNPNWFQRLRNGDTPELTKKRKINANNNWERIEYDLPLDSKRLNEKTVKGFVGLDGY